MPEPERDRRARRRPHVRRHRKTQHDGTSLKLGIEFNAGSVVDVDKARAQLLARATTSRPATASSTLHRRQRGRHAAGGRPDLRHAVLRLQDRRATIRALDDPLAPGGIDRVLVRRRAAPVGSTSTSRARPDWRTARRSSTTRRRRSRSPATWSTSRSTATANLVRSGGERRPLVEQRQDLRVQPRRRSAPTSTTASRSSTPPPSSPTTRRRPAWSCSAGCSRASTTGCTSTAATRTASSCRTATCHAGCRHLRSDARRSGNGDESTPCSSNIQTLSAQRRTSRRTRRRRPTRCGAPTGPRSSPRATCTSSTTSSTDTSFRLLDPVTLAPVVPFSGGNSNGTHRLVNEGIAIVSNGTGTQRLDRRPRSPRAPARRTCSPASAARSRSSARGRRRQRHLDRHRRRPVRPARRDARSRPPRPKVTTTIGSATLRGEDIVDLERVAGERRGRVDRRGRRLRLLRRVERRTRTSRTPSTRRSRAARISSRRTTSRSPRKRHRRARTARPSTRPAASSPAPTPTRRSRSASTSRRRVDGHGRRQPHGADRLGRRLRREDLRPVELGRPRARTRTRTTTPSQGIRIGQSFGALVESRIADGATILGEAGLRLLGRRVAARRRPRERQRHVQRLSAKADSRASARAAALGADSDASAYVIGTATAPGSCSKATR